MRSDGRKAVITNVYGADGTCTYIDSTPLDGEDIKQTVQRVCEEASKMLPPKQKPEKWGLDELASPQRGK